MATASKHQRQADHFTRTNNLTLAKVAQAKTLPDPLPSREYHGLVNLLRCYVMLLHHVVGERS